jgi:hypothetical protein
MTRAGPAARQRRERRAACVAGPGCVVPGSIGEGRAYLAAPRQLTMRQQCCYFSLDVSAQVEYVVHRSMAMDVAALQPFSGISSLNSGRRQRRPFSLNVLSPGSCAGRSRPRRAPPRLRAGILQLRGGDYRRQRRRTGSAGPIAGPSTGHASRLPAIRWLEPPRLDPDRQPRSLPRFLCVPYFRPVGVALPADFP